MIETTQRVRSSDGVELAVFEYGNREHPTVVVIHGYPDNHHVWDGVIALLVDHYHVVAYDVRGAGESDQPRGRAAYRNEQLTDDFVAVLDAVSPDEPVHLLAHDWGSIQSWPTLADPRVEGRVVSFTSISGPSLEHAAAWIRRFRRNPRGVLRQVGHSYYMFLFQLPALPELAARRHLIERGVERFSSTSRVGDPVDVHRTDTDSVNGIQIYRANMLRNLARPKPPRVSIPVQVLAPEKDPHVTVDVQTEAPVPYVADLRTRVISGGHWVVADRPDVIVDCFEEFIASLPARGATTTGRSAR